MGERGKTWQYRAAALSFFRPLARPLARPGIYKYTHVCALRSLQLKTTTDVLLSFFPTPFSLLASMRDDDGPRGFWMGARDTGRHRSTSGGKQMTELGAMLGWSPSHHSRTG